MAELASRLLCRYVGRRADRLPTWCLAIESQRAQTTSDAIDEVDNAEWQEVTRAHCPQGDHAGWKADQGGQRDQEYSRPPLSSTCPKDGPGEKCDETHQKQDGEPRGIRASPFAARLKNARVTASMRMPDLLTEKLANC